MELVEFHILQRQAAPQRQGGAIARQAMGVAREGPHPSPTAGGEERRFSVENMPGAAAQLERHAAADRRAIHRQIHDVEFVEESDFLLDALLIKRLQDHMPGAISGMAGASNRAFAKVARMAAEAALADPAGRGAVEGQAHVLQLDDGRHGVFSEHLRGVLVGQVIATLHGVVGVPEGVVFFQIAERGADPAQRGAGVAACRVQLADDGDFGPAHAGVEGSHQPRAARPDDDGIINVSLRIGHRVARAPS